MNPWFSIGSRRVGLDYPPLVVAEIGINHEGSLEVAKEMVDAAVVAGAEVIKHQTHIVEDEMSEEARQVIPGNADISIYEIIERCALSDEEERELQRYVNSKGAIFISTPFSRSAAYRLQDMAVPAYKIGSGECNNYPLLKLIASFGKPIILSTGMNGLESIRKSVAIFRNAGIPYALLHCTNVYPTAYKDVRLGGVTQLLEAFPDAVVGLSDHTVDNYACLGAVSLGASILERHFTDSKARPGPDISCSMTPPDLEDLILGSRAIAEARGGEKGPIPAEAATISFAFGSVVVTENLTAGTVITEDVLWLRRPGTGDFGPDDFDCLIGRKLTTDIKSGEQLAVRHVS